MDFFVVEIGVSHTVCSSKEEGEVVTSSQLYVYPWDSVIALPFLRPFSQPIHWGLEKLFLYLVLLCSVELMKQEK